MSRFRVENTEQQNSQVNENMSNLQSNKNAVGIKPKNILRLDFVLRSNFNQLEFFNYISIQNFEVTEFWKTEEGPFFFVMKSGVVYDSFNI